MQDKNPIRIFKLRLNRRSFKSKCRDHVIKNNRKIELINAFKERFFELSLRLRNCKVLARSYKVCMLLAL